jgi:putative membrane protein
MDSVMATPDKLFTEQDKQRLAEAVRKAERSTSGEIVPYVVGRSDSYPESWLRAGALTGFLALFAFGLIDMGTNIWLPFGMGEAAIIVAAAFGAGALLALSVPAVRRLFIPGAMLQQRVDERATMAFLEEEVFKTRERTGILIFLSLFERRVRVLGDSGINAKVKQEQWDGIVSSIVTAMKRGEPAAGMLAAIEQCGSLLEASGVEIRDDDTNELDNELRISDR